MGEPTGGVGVGEEVVGTEGVADKGALEGELDEAGSWLTRRLLGEGTLLDVDEAVDDVDWLCL